MIHTVYRPWESRDIPDIAKLMSAHSLWTKYGIDRASAENRLQHLWAQRELGFIFESEPGTILGFVLYNRQTFGGSGYIRWIGVDTGAVGQGIGQALLQRVEYELCLGKVFRLVLLCAEWNHAARRFYERMGFSEIGLLPDWVVPGTTEVLYGKHLDPL